MDNNAIIVLTPVKNEEWIIESFLSACSVFADHIILLVQDTHDQTRELAEKFPKAHIIENTSAEYSENSRINQLLAAARKIESGQKALIALDADEIPINSKAALEQWQYIRELPVGQNITFKKPDLLPGGSTMVDLSQDWILGFVDDGREHNASEVHAQRIPINEDMAPYSANEIPVLHLNLVRMNVNRSKRRMYCVIENLNNSQSWIRRLYSYDRHRDFTTAGEEVSLPQGWKVILQQASLDTTALSETHPFWQDYEVLKYFKSHGTKRFQWDDIWDCNWEAARQDCLARGWSGVPDERIPPPTILQSSLREILSHGVRLCFWIKRTLWR